ncbi:unnamed protein product [Diatraea saccharalis]|uniref:BPTI/Kunitz inhibitor domain-containing protein n=1 Tax=Diatraea saccharalis TaxID=40085 RepID=A0A9N9RDP4_9NEOP|nr:unnamed protein product [Diatraea saccharalis]
MNKLLVIIVLLCVGYCVAIDPVCLLPTDTGPCRALKTRYAYKQVQGECVTFTYGGCQGNANNFESLDQCRKTCL